MATFTLYAAQGDTAPTQYLHLRNTDGSPIDLTSATEVHFEVPEWGIDISCTVENAANGEISFEWGSALVGVSGTANCQIKIIWSGGKVQHLPSDAWGQLIVREA